MKKRTFGRESWRELCAELHADDGVATKYKKCDEPRGGHDSKVLRLCGQALRALRLGVADCADPVLQQLFIAAVAPAPDASRLIVTVAPCPGATCGPAEVLSRLSAAQALLRHQVALVVNRKKAPQLVFRIGTTEETSP